MNLINEAVGLAYHYSRGRKSFPLQPQGALLAQFTLRRTWRREGLPGPLPTLSPSRVYPIFTPAKCFNELPPK